MGEGVDEGVGGRDLEDWREIWRFVSPDVGCGDGSRDSLPSPPGVLPYVTSSLFFPLSSIFPSTPSSSPNGPLKPFGVAVPSVMVDPSELMMVGSSSSTLIPPGSRFVRRRSVAGGVYSAISAGAERGCEVLVELDSAVRAREAVLKVTQYTRWLMEHSCFFWETPTFPFIRVAALARILI